MMMRRMNKAYVAKIYFPHQGSVAVCVYLFSFVSLLLFLTPQTWYYKFYLGSVIIGWAIVRYSVNKTQETLPGNFRARELDFNHISRTE